MIEPTVADVLRTCPHLSESVHRTEQRRGEKNRGLGEGLNRSVDSPSPSLLPTTREIWQLLLGGLHALSENDFGRPWPYPDRRRLAELAAQHDPDLCLRAARQAREIVVSQDRAPNVTALFERKLHELAEVRGAVRQGLQDTGYSDVEFVDLPEGDHHA